MLTANIILLSLCMPFTYFGVCGYIVTLIWACLAPQIPRLETTHQYQGCYNYTIFNVTILKKGGK